MSPAEDILNNMPEELTERSPSGNLALVAAFIASATIACIVILGLGSYFLNAPRTLWPFGAGKAVSYLDSSSTDFENLLVSSAGTYLKANLGESGNPKVGEDYAILVTFKLRRIPSDGEAFALVGKFDAELPGRPGFALSLEGAPDGVRPRVYVSIDGTPARWHSFSSYPMSRRDWYVVSFVFSEDTFVSTSVARAFSNDTPTFLGAHRLSGGVPKSKADLVIGAFGSSRFRGQIGPFAVLSGAKLAKKISGYISANRANPRSIPDDIAAEDVVFWGSPLIDLGDRKFSIIKVEGASSNNGKGAEVARKERASGQLKRIAPVKKVPQKTGKKAR